MNAMKKQQAKQQEQDQQHQRQYLNGTTTTTTGAIPSRWLRGNTGASGGEEGGNRRTKQQQQQQQRRLDLGLGVALFDIHQKYFVVIMNNDRNNEEVVLTAGPFTITATCGIRDDHDSINNHVSLKLGINPIERDIFVFGELTDDRGLNDWPIERNGILDSDESYSEDIWDITNNGHSSGGGNNDVDVGGAWISDGTAVFYIGMDGDSMIGIARDGLADTEEDVQAILDDDTQCIVAGGFNIYGYDPGCYYGDTIYCVDEEENEEDDEDEDNGDEDDDEEDGGE